MEELLSYILKKLTSKPEKVKIQKKQENSEIVFIITLDEEDKGKIIGKEGRNIKALRNILAILAKQNQERVFLKVE